MINVGQTESAWAIVELMGRNRYGGKVSKDAQFGTGMLHIEVPHKDGTFISQLINPNSLYRLTFCSEELAREAALHGQSTPMHPMEVKHLLPSSNAGAEEHGDLGGTFRDSEVVYDEPRFAS